jgi:exosortase A-associated hydrolase 2
MSFALDAPPDCDLLATYIDGVNGSVFLAGRRPSHDTVNDRAVLILPPFAEEMNKARRMLALQSQFGAQHGISFFLPDVVGTGDSEGDFEACRWGHWEQDVLVIVQWIRAQGFTSVDLLALRSGIFLARRLLEEPIVKIGRVVLWNPVLSGKKMMGQLRRTRRFQSREAHSGASAIEAESYTVSTPIVELAGYRIHSELIAEIETLLLERLTWPRGTNVHWLDVSLLDDDTVPSRTEAVLEKWRQSGVDAHYLRLIGRPFWLGPEIEIVPELLKVTTGLLTAAVSQ